jgi:hypothetical protein
VLPAEAAAGKTLLAQAFAAKGGAALAKVENVFLHGSGNMSQQGQSMPISIEEHIVPGKAARQDITIAGMSIVQAVAEGKGFAKQGAKLIEMPPQAVEQMLKALWRDPNFILLHASQPGAQVRGLTPVQEGKLAYDVLEIIAPDGDSTRLYLDQKTHLIARMTYKSEDTDVRELLSDYQTESGIQWARKVSHEGGPQKLDIAYDKVQINQKLPKDFFKAF